MMWYDSPRLPSRLVLNITTIARHLPSPYLVKKKKKKKGLMRKDSCTSYLTRMKISSSEVSITPSSSLHLQSNKEA